MHWRQGLAMEESFFIIISFPTYYVCTKWYARSCRTICNIRCTLYNVYNMQYEKCNELTVQYAKCIFLLSNKFSQTCSGSKIKQQKIFLFKMSHQRIKISKTLVLNWPTFLHKYLHFRLRCSIHSSAAGVDDIPKGECLGHNSNNLKIWYSLSAPRP